MKIVSDRAIVDAPESEVFEFLSDARNFEKILPKDKISDFRADDNGCSFKAPGGFLIQLLYISKTPYTRIDMKSGEDAPFDFTLVIHLKPKDAKTEGYLEFKGDVNMFLRMMVEKPLVALFNSMADKLREVFHQ
jgi:carbon monoxide dehydrogenase subunit G